MQYQNLIQLIEFIDKNYQNKNALNFYQGQKWLSFSNSDFANNVYSLALAFKSIGLKAEDGFAILAVSSPIWLLVDFAIMTNRAISVPIFADVSSENLIFEIKNTDIRFVFCDCLKNLEILKNSGIKFDKIITYGFEYEGENVINFDKILSNGKVIYQTNPEIFNKLCKEIKPYDIATIVYTSGSTGIPKGVEITHQNLLAQIASADQIFLLNNQDVALSFLPLAHIFERMIVIFYLSKGVKIYFCDDIKNVSKFLQEIKPTLTTVVPRVLEKVFNAMKEGLEDTYGLKKIIANLAFFAAKRLYYQKKIRNFFGYQFLDFLVYRKLRLALGGNLKMIICGGAALAIDIEKFFLGIGVNLYVGYGTTESSPVIAANCPNYHKIATVGRAFPDVEVKISNEGELLARGKNIMKGYHKNLGKTQEVMVDDWLKTGDLARIDRDGFIQIVGRSKELFKTANGKYVSPNPIEQKLLIKSPFLMAASIIAEGRRFVACLLFLDFDMLDKFKKRLKLEDLDNEQFLANSLLDSYVANLIFEVNKNLNHWEQIRKYKLIKQRISVESGELTPSMKIRRGFIEEKYQKIIDKLYLE